MSKKVNKYGKAKGGKNKQKTNDMGWEMFMPLIVFAAVAAAAAYFSTLITV